MKQTRKIITFALASILAICSFCRINPASASTDKILVSDLDKDGAISIGDKYCLGSECFYILEVKDGSIKGLSEYNLYTGYTIYDVTNDPEYLAAMAGTSADRATFYNEHNYQTCIERYIWQTDSDIVYCYEPLQIDLDFTFFDDDERYQDATWDALADVVNSYDYCRFTWASTYTNGYQNRNLIYCLNATRNDTKVLQSSKAISAHGDERGILEHPEIGDHFFSQTFNNYLLKYNNYDANSTDIFYDNDNNLIKGTYGELFSDDANMIDYYGADVSVNYIYEPVFEYEKNLEDAGYTISDISLLSYNDLADFLTSVNEKNMTFEHNGYGCNDVWIEGDDESWSCASTPWIWRYAENDGLSYGYSSLTEYVPEQYDWIYSTSYWLSTAFWNTFEEQKVAQNYQFFVDTLGDLCFVNGSTTCDTEDIGAGIRPVVTMTEDLFILNTMDLNGTIRWVDNNNERGIRPQKTTVNLYRNGVLFDSIEVTSDNDGDVWSFGFLGVPKWDESGEEYVYTIKQDDIEMYVSDISDFNIVNEFSIESINPNTGSISPFIYGGVAISSALVGFAVFARKRR